MAEPARRASPMPLERRTSLLDHPTSVLSALFALDVFTRAETMMLDKEQFTPRSSPNATGAVKPSADVVFNLAREMAKRTMEQPAAEFALRDMELDVHVLAVRTHTFKKRLLLLSSHTLEVFASDGPAGRPLLTLNLTPDCIVKDGQTSPFALDLITLRDVLHIACASEREKMQLAGALARAILQPRSGSAIKVCIPKAHLPSVKQDLPKTPSRLLFDAQQRLSVSSSQPSSQEHEQILDLAQRGSVLMEGYALKQTTGKFGQPVRRGFFKKSPQRRFFQLHRHVLYYWRTEALSHTRAPQAFVFLDFSTRIRRVPDTPAVEVVTALRTVLLRFKAEDELERWVEAFTAALETSAVLIKRYMTYAKSKEAAGLSSTPQLTSSNRDLPIIDSAPVSRKTVVYSETSAVAPLPALEPPPSSTALPLSPPEQQPLPPVSSAGTAPAPVPIFVVPAVSPTSASPLVASVEQAAPPEDPRPRFRVVCAQGEGSAEPIEVGWVHCEPTVPLAVVRDELHQQLGDVPIRFSFLRPADALRSQLGQTQASRLTSAQELDMILKDCLDTEGVLHLTAPLNLVSGAANFDDERRALLQEIRHLEALLAEARRANLSLKQDHVGVDVATAVGAALMALQRDGFVAADLSIDALEKDYLTLMHPDDVSRVLLAQSSPFKVAFRRLASEPARLKNFLDLLSRDVLAAYGIRASRLNSPFWQKALRDVRLIDAPEEFKAWAKNEPWCEDDQERFSYLSAKMLVRSADPADFAVLQRDPKGTSQPAKRAPPAGGGGGATLAHDALAAFQQRSMRLSKAASLRHAASSTSEEGKDVVTTPVPTGRPAALLKTPSDTSLHGAPQTPGSRSPSIGKRKSFEPAVMPEDLTRVSAESLHSYDQEASHLPSLVEGVKEDEELL